jgi:hypothetical protein
LKIATTAATTAATTTERPTQQIGLRRGKESGQIWITTTQRVPTTMTAILT